MRVLILPFELALLLARIPLDLHRALRQARESDGSCAPASVSSALGRHPPHRQPLCVVAATASDAQIH